jgi:hypothetical protein
MEMSHSLEAARSGSCLLLNLLGRAHSLVSLPCALHVKGGMTSTDRASLEDAEALYGI